MTAKTIILRVLMEALSEPEQDKIFVLSRENNVFVEDANGVLWQVLDLTEPIEQSTKEKE